MSATAATETRAIYTTAELFKVPTLDEYSGKESFAYIAPKSVSSMTPSTIQAGDSRTDVQGTVVYTAQEAYFVPLPIDEVASLLYIALVTPTSSTGTNYAPPTNQNV